MPSVLSFKKQDEFYLKVEAKTDTHAVIELYGVVGGDFFESGITSKDVIDQLKKLPASIKTLDLRINSPGGSVFEGLAIMNRIKSYGQKVKITAYIDALSASIASIIMLGAEKVVMEEGSFIMIHKPMSGTYGNSDDLEKVIAILDDIENQMINLYVKKTKLSRLEIKDLLSKETWMDADEAIRLGFADEKIETGLQVAACVSASMKWSKAPSSLRTKDVLAKKAVLELQNKMQKFLAR